eukprot:3290356-Rhodomonas_salina.1
MESRNEMQGSWVERVLQTGYRIYSDKQVQILAFVHPRGKEGEDFAWACECGKVVEFEGGGALDAAEFDADRKGLQLRTCGDGRHTE